MQLQPDFPLDAAAALAEYLAALGVSHLYSSPLLQAAAGSVHGYDVVDPHRVNAELGGADAFTRLTDALAAQGLGLVLDIVPNHMAIGGRENAWWWDVLENGPSSRYARYFDVDWDPPEARLRNRVLLPILGERYGQALAEGKLQVNHERGGFTLRYFDHTFPIAPGSLDTLLASAAGRLDARQGSQAYHGAQADQLAFLAAAFAALPPATATDSESA
ncbi:MAG: alpha-amylase family glycosyl hydrolase, partial [Ktedonobacterales bacterium]